MSLRLALALAGVVAVIMAGAGAYWKGRLAGMAAERPKVAAALDRAEVAGLEVEGARTSAARVDVVVRQRDAAAQSVAQLTPVILNSEAAHVPLDPERSARLRRHDRQLCQLAGADLAGCAPAP